MPRKSNRERKPPVEQTRIAIRVEGFEASADASINYHLYQPQFGAGWDERDPVYLFKSHLQITGEATWPVERAGDTYELAIIGDDSPSRDLALTLDDVQAREKTGARKYRRYRGREIPVYVPPPGMGLINKMRGEPRWTAWAFVTRGFVQDALAILSLARPLYVSLHERKQNRSRWVQGLTVQTVDPETE